MTSKRLQITDAIIRRYAKTNTYQLSDTRYPVKFRYLKGRERGSWYLVGRSGGREVWSKIGAYPALGAKQIFDMVPALVVDFAKNPLSAGIAKFEFVAELLTWYRDRATTARYLGKRRRSAVASIVNKHLIPKLGEFAIADLNHDIVDQLLIQTMQADYSLAYTRQVFDVLRVAFKQAQKLRHIGANPIAGFAFGDFISAPIKSRDGRLKRAQLPALFSGLQEHKPAQQMLCLMMLLMGTRIGETKMIRWDHIDWGDKMLLIPSENTKTKESHRLPLTDYAIALLKRYRACQEIGRYKGVYLFPNRQGGCLSGTSASNAVSAVSGGDWSAHDLRKLARTCWADLGVDYMVSERLLNHTLTKLDQAYIHTYVETQKRAALVKYHDWLRRTGLDSIVLEF